MSYVVLSRRYRPQAFSDVFGQEHVARTLESALRGGRVAHAYLFCGPRGVGKTTMARLLAKAVNCLVSPGVSPCGSCEACRGIAAGGDVDVLEIDAASNRKVEEVQPLVEASRYLPQRSPRKIFLVDEVHMLSNTAFNALLKTLEEPPPHVLFILATTEPHKVPETVRSRCQRFDFKRITDEDISAKLRKIAQAEGAEVAPEVLSEIARRAAGGLRDAESMLDQLLSAAPEGRALGAGDLAAILGGIPKETRSRLLDLAHAGDLKGVLDAAAEVVDAGADPSELLRDLYGDLRDVAVDAARHGPTQGGPGVDWCLAAAEQVARHLSLATRSRAARPTLDLALLALARLGDVRDLEELAERLERLGGGAPAAPGAAAAAAAAAAAPRASPRAAPDAAPAPPSAPSSASLASPASPASPAAPRASALAKWREKHRDPLAGGAGRRENEDVRPAPPAGPSLSGEELARLRSAPAVRQVLDVFGGVIEQVKRDGEGIS